MILIDYYLILETFHISMIFYTNSISLINYTSIIFYTNLFSLIKYTSIIFYTSKPLFLHDDLDTYFYNRKEDIKKLKYKINSLNYSLPQQILLTGYRGVGKTYLLKKIMHDLEPNIICTYIDISKIYALEKRKLTIETVLIELLKEMN